MFDELLRELKRLEGSTRISISMELDEDGYLDRQCPMQNCLATFKVLGEDWSQKLLETAYCPFCGGDAPATEWSTSEQNEYLQEAATGHVSTRINKAMRKDTSRVNRRGSTDFISITMKVNDSPLIVQVPPHAAEPMRLKIQCSECGFRYAVIGAAYFCHACGHNDARLLFRQTISRIRDVLDSLDEIRKAIADQDTAEYAVRSLVENGLEDAVTAFQKWADSLYGEITDAPEARRNAFLSLEEGSRLWSSATGKGYREHITVDEMKELLRGFQQRHLLAHQQGIVDRDYIARSGDSSYQEGQRIVVDVATVDGFLDLIEKLASGISDAIGRR